MDIQTPILEMKHVTKTFYGVVALDDINFSLRKGEIHALLGENGAGKSTLMKILSGVYFPDKGQIFIRGNEYRFKNTVDARKAGISIIHQELNLCENLSVADNMFLGRENSKFGILNARDIKEQTQRILDDLSLSISADSIVNTLPIAQKQMIEIAKAVSLGTQILIMDEPTSSLTSAEEEVLFSLIERLKRNGTSIVYISHKLSEVFRICDRVTVLRDGAYIGTKDINEVTEESLIAMMVGRSITNIYPEAQNKINRTKPVFEVKNLCASSFVKDASFCVYPGEILGFSGLVGSGRTEIAKAVFGCFKKTSGALFLNGQKIIIDNPQQAIKQGIAFVTEDRKLEGLALGLSVGDNIMASNYDLISQAGVVQNVKSSKLISDGIKKLKVKTPGPKTHTEFLSGGNQQKVILARCLSKDIKLLILDEPTRGIDIGAKTEIDTLMRELSNRGVAIIMISSELPEILGMCDRIAVMRSRRIVTFLNKEQANQESIMRYAAGGVDVE